ncbi:restriction endonuclease subunit S [Vagococcus lutrae]|uniref:restriction endonuclease subunit S n=1 Tax=Vagococcus lutrae TaxID=81947 RepID=UPI00288E2D15|nr:restriction endonuclease subunit S [Vagococcus lutrae]
MIRFKNYNEDWEQRKLGELLKYEQPTRYIVSSTAYDNEFDTPVLTAGQSFILGYTNEINGIKNASKNNPVIIFDDFTTSSHYVDFPFKVKSSAMKLLELKQNTDDFYFVYNILKNINYIPQTHERHWISIFSHFKVFLPTSSEQQKVGSFLKQLDDIIALHQRKLEALEKTKKSFLQKMFPKKDETKPEIRFAGYTDDWEQRKFSEMIKSIRTGTNLLGKTTNKGIPLIKMGNIQRGYFDLIKIEYLSENDEVEEENMVRYGDFLFNTRNTLLLVGKGATWFGKSDEYAFNSNIAKFKFKGIDTIFFNYLYNTSEIIKQVQARAVGTTSVAAVYPRDLNSLIFSIPVLKEQQKIGAFFKQLDDTIALHQRQLEALEMTKNSFLQKMFI